MCICPFNVEITYERSDAMPRIAKCRRVCAEPKHKFFKSDTLAVGPQQKLGISQEVVDNVGSVFNIFGAEQLIKIQNIQLMQQHS